MNTTPPYELSDADAASISNPSDTIHAKNDLAHANIEEASEIDFGFKKVKTHEKEGLVKAIFSNVASNYDLMNDVMSLGVHRIWKKIFAGHVNPRAGEKILDIAGGTGDIAKQLYLNSHRKADILLTDINQDMLAEGKKRLLDEGIIIPTMVCDAQNLPFENNSFHKITAAFGVRNMTDKKQALKSMYRCLKPGGALFVLEFSEPVACLQGAYEFYSFNVIPKMGEWFAKDRDSYQYLVESIKMHPNQIAFAELFKEAGFENVKYINLSFGIAAIHIGYKY
jgi:demethylmenaquinone methyltransferase / 2-methoxy-6-polyprenyl-1,4-benzoquinol methylase